jgi:ABC-type dipeptide/oligopeptide/nickel transport system permease component
MITSLAHRTLASGLVLWGVATLVFVLLRVLPGNPAEIMLAGSAASQADIAQLRQELGLDEPLQVQYGNYLLHLLQGDLGRSWLSRQPVTQIIAQQAAPTLALAAAALGVTVLVGLGLGTLAALRAGSWVDWLTMGGAVLGVSTPIFWSGLLLMWVFSLELRWLPASGADGWRHLVMPALVLGLLGAGPLARLVRTNLLDALRADYIGVARAKGLTDRLVVGRHALRNALIPSITMIGLQAGFLLGGTVVTETVFARPGLGRLVVDAILSKDLPVVQGVVLLIAAGYVLVNLLVDGVAVMLDPRLRA